MSGPDRIWAYEINYPISKAHGEQKWVPWEPKPVTLQMREGFFGRKTRQIPQVFTEYIRRAPAVLAALPEVQALTAAAEARALNSVTTLHTVISDIRAATVGTKPMLSELAAALVAWRDEAVRAEREASARLVDCGCDKRQKAAVIEAKTSAERARACGQYNCGAEDADAIRKRGEG